MTSVSYYALLALLALLPPVLARYSRGPVERLKARVGYVRTGAASVREALAVAWYVLVVGGGGYFGVTGRKDVLPLLAAVWVCVAAVLAVGAAIAYTLLPRLLNRAGTPRALRVVSILALPALAGLGLLYLVISRASAGTGSPIMVVLVLVVLVLSAILATYVLRR